MTNSYKWIWATLLLLSPILLLSSFLKWVSISPTEVFGFITGVVCVVLVVQQNIWNFPIGIANNFFFIILFFTSRLYGDMALQVVYIVLGAIGWWQWLFGGKNRSNRIVNYASIQEVMILAIIGIVLTIALRTYFIKITEPLKISIKMNFYDTLDNKYNI